MHFVSYTKVADTKSAVAGQLGERGSVGNGGYPCINSYGSRFESSGTGSRKS